MTHQEIKELAGHRAVSPWVMKLVGDAVAKERERLTDAAMKAAEKAVDSAIALEREACAKVALTYDSQPWSHAPASAHVADMVSISIGKAIRARGQ